MNRSLQIQLVCFALVFALGASLAESREVRVPLTVDHTMIREALVHQLFTDHDERAVFWGEPGECSFFYLRDPKVEGQVASLRIIAAGEARLGTDLGATCLSPIAWSGFVELFERPRIDGWKLRFDVVDSNLYDQKHEKALLVGQLWDRIKEDIQPRFGAVTIDLGGPFRDLRDFLSTIVPPSNADEARQAIDSLHPVSVSAVPKGIVVQAALDLPDTVGHPAPSATEPPLSAAEAEAFIARANQWDAFLTFVIKTLGTRTLRKPARQALLDTLIDARQQISEAVTTPSRKEDLVREFFLKSWDRLRPVADDIARDLPGAEAAQILTFVAAGDALAALDQAGPSFGIEVSADGLRRMARMIAPSGSGDPLNYDIELDPVLRRTLGFGAPLSDTDAEAPVPEPTSGWLAPFGRSELATRIAPAGRDRLWPSWLFTLLAPAEAAAASTVDHSHDWRGWLVDEGRDVAAYLKRVNELLGRTASETAAREELSAADRDLLHKLLPATAWQESCWRQFRKKDDGAVTYLKSSRGSVGMMQVNERVWRGFYSVDALRWKVAYNIQAGAEVLLHYMRDMQEGGEEGGAAPPSPPAQVAARTIYAGYNGGPSQMRRYLDPKRRGRALAHVVDQLFGTKFDAIGGSVEEQVASCLVGGPA